MRNRTEAERNDPSIGKEPHTDYKEFVFDRNAYASIGGGQWLDMIMVTQEAKEEYHDVMFDVEDAEKFIAWLHGAIADIKSRPHWELRDL